MNRIIKTGMFAIALLGALTFTTAQAQETMTPFRNEKNSNWEGAFRVPCMVARPYKTPCG
jgi:arylsulfatase A-like enzyme